MLRTHVDQATLSPAGSRIKRRRKQIGYSQEALADVIGVSTKTISRAEVGKPVLAATLDRIVAALGVAPGELCDPARISAFFGDMLSPRESPFRQLDVDQSFLIPGELDQWQLIGLVVARRDPEE